MTQYLAGDVIVGCVRNPEWLGRAILIVTLAVPSAWWHPRLSVYGIPVDRGADRRHLWGIHSCRRRALLPLDKRVWRTVAVGYPLFLVSGTWFSAHLYAAPSVVLAAAR